MARLDFEFVGTCTTKVSLDPTEFIGMSVPQITSEVLRVLKSIAPEVSYYEDDVVLAADELARG